MLHEFSSTAAVDMKAEHSILGHCCDLDCVGTLDESSSQITGPLAMNMVALQRTCLWVRPCNQPVHQAAILAATAEELFVDRVPHRARHIPSVGTSVRVELLEHAQVPDLNRKENRVRNMQQAPLLKPRIISTTGSLPCTTDPDWRSAASCHLRSTAQTSHARCVHAALSTHRRSWHPTSAQQDQSLQRSTARQAVCDKKSQKCTARRTLISRSLLPDAMRPCEGCQSADVTSPPWPAMTRSSAQVAKSHTYQPEWALC